MAFWKNKSDEPSEEVAPSAAANVLKPSLSLIIGDAAVQIDETHVGSHVAVQSAEEAAGMIRSALSVLAIFQSRASLDSLLTAIIAERAQRADGFPVLVIAVRPEQLCDLGEWLHDSAVSERLQGTRLIVAESSQDAIRQLPSRIAPIKEPKCHPHADFD